ncbi:Uncharacterized protein dnm_076050 [Desulfonema magnum]|uniref:Uncharacterized protein n=1 Tax=Desulfonema magnum TaxID=45655 RepID=A0A975BTT3_9BACT|nr:Uncharacterized protein dnm_076050 [Desulfonema magnum]
MHMLFGWKGGNFPKASICRCLHIDTDAFLGGNAENPKNI